MTVIVLSSDDIVVFPQKIITFSNLPNIDNKFYLDNFYV